MTQRIFDIDNKKDMHDLWSILPDEAYSIKKSVGCQTWRRKGENTGYYFDFVNINWHDKTEITRPVDYESMIGCVGWFWDNSESSCVIGILNKYRNETDFPFWDGYSSYKNFRPAKKSELKFWREDL